mmetsp:Transcript_26766/g.86677  ORF Transcript_26766/g.86677 Transcript_26766/m.86677 type:complete len:279 (+) Transcript_26766:361-1197(+)
MVSVNPLASCFFTKRSTRPRETLGDVGNAPTRIAATTVCVGVASSTAARRRRLSDRGRDAARASRSAANGSAASTTRRGFSGSSSTFFAVVRAKENAKSDVFFKTRSSTIARRAVANLASSKSASDDADSVRHDASPRKNSGCATACATWNFAPRCWQHEEASEEEESSYELSYWRSSAVFSRSSGKVATASSTTPGQAASCSNRGHRFASSTRDRKIGASMSSFPRKASTSAATARCNSQATARRSPAFLAASSVAAPFSVERRGRTQVLRFVSRST